MRACVRAVIVQQGKYANRASPEQALLLSSSQYPGSQSSQVLPAVAVVVQDVVPAQLGSAVQAARWARDTNTHRCVNLAILRRLPCLSECSHTRRPTQTHKHTRVRARSLTRTETHRGVLRTKADLSRNCLEFDLRQQNQQCRRTSRCQHSAAHYKPYPRFRLLLDQSSRRRPTAICL